MKAELDAISEKCPDADYLMLDVSRHEDELERLVPEHDVIVSLLPYALHPQVAKYCIKHKRNMVTASYLSPAMKELHKE